MTKPEFAKGREELPGANKEPEEQKTPAQQHGKTLRMKNSISMFKYVPDEKDVNLSLWGNENGPAGAVPAGIPGITIGKKV